MPTAAEAVANLKRLIGSTNTRTRRKRSAPTSSRYLTDIYKQPLNPIYVVNWTGEIQFHTPIKVAKTFKRFGGVSLVFGLWFDNSELHTE